MTAYKFLYFGIRILPWKLNATEKCYASEKKKEKTKNPTQKNPQHHFFLKEQQ